MIFPVPPPTIAAAKTTIISGSTANPFWSIT